MDLRPGTILHLFWGEHRGRAGRCRPPGGRLVRRASRIEPLQALRTEWSGTEEGEF
jgi:hypothetical protein